MIWRHYVFRCQKKGEQKGSTNKTTSTRIERIETMHCICNGYGRDGNQMNLCAWTDRHTVECFVEQKKTKEKNSHSWRTACTIYDAHTSSHAGTRIFLFFFLQFHAFLCICIYYYISCVEGSSMLCTLSIVRLPELWPEQLHLLQW